MKLGNNMNLNLFETHFKSLDRSQFIPDDFKHEANYDTPLPIGFNQTISQPSLVKQMILLLDPHPTDTVLEIGTGSGYLTALLSPFVQRIISLEIIPELARQANARLKNMGYHNIEVIISDGSFGYKNEPYWNIVGKDFHARAAREPIGARSRGLRDRRPAAARTRAGRGAGAGAGGGGEFSRPADDAWRLSAQTRVALCARAGVFG